MHREKRASNIDIIQVAYDSGLLSLNIQEFLEESSFEFLRKYSLRFQLRINILRLIIFRQGGSFKEADWVIAFLASHEGELDPDEFFMFKCESIRIYLLKKNIQQAILLILDTVSILPYVSKEIKDYWHHILIHTYMQFGVDKELLNLCLADYYIPDNDYVYSMAWNRHVYFAGIVVSLLILKRYQEVRMASINYSAFLETQDLPVKALTYMLSLQFLISAISKEPLDPEKLKKVKKHLTPVNFHGVIMFNLATAIDHFNSRSIRNSRIYFKKLIDFIKNLMIRNRIILLACDLIVEYLAIIGSRKLYIEALELRIEISNQQVYMTSSGFSELISNAANLIETKNDLNNSKLELIHGLALACEHRDDSTGQHTRRVERYVYEIASRMQLENASEIAEASRLHDIGKIGIPDRLLLKEGIFTKEEKDEMELHTKYGAKMLDIGSSSLIKIAKQIAQSHHERWDGTGYPEQLRGEEIPLSAQIVAIADVYDALTSKRSYKAAWTPQDALAEIQRQSGAHFDPAVVKVFTVVVREVLSSPNDVSAQIMEFAF